jgi:malate synthase
MNPLSSECIQFLSALERYFGNKRKALLEERRYKDFRIVNVAQDYKCNPAPEEIADRTVEITGPPVPAKMVINAVTSGANCYMADFEDSFSPTWKNVLEGQKNLMMYLQHKLDYKDKLTNCDKPAVLWVRPRGLHMREAHMFDMSASLFDFGVFMFNNAYTLKARGSRPYIYLPKLERPDEARWWAEVFAFTEKHLHLKSGTIKCTILVETLPAIFNLDPIIYELRDYIVGANAGRWDYLFSFIKHGQPEYSLPDRSQLNMKQPFMKAYSDHLVNTCLKRRITPMGGMSAFIPVKDEEANQKALDAVKLDKQIEAEGGYRGAWVAHPGLVDTVKEVFGSWKYLRPRNQNVTKEDLLRQPVGETTREGMVNNCKIAVEYLAAWLSGNGCVPINNLMEDMATAEIARTQLWNWAQTGAYSIVEMREVLREAANELPDTVFVRRAKAIIEHAAINFSWLEDFLTRDAYENLLALEEEGEI